MTTTSGRYINGHLVVDLGGIHGPETANVTINAASNSGALPAATTSATVTVTLTAAQTQAQLGLVDGGMYSIDLFQAERHVTGSNYTATLGGFVHTISQCSAVCGDGLVKGNEVCDDGVNNGSYGGCMSGCTGRAPYCGDGVVTSPPEGCDDGTNATTYGGAAKVCAPGCQFAPYCGDGIITNGEQCDMGAQNGMGLCGANCTQGSYYYTDTFTRDYDGSSCPAGTHVVWIDAGLEAMLPASGGTNTSIQILAQTGSSVATLSPMAPIAIGTLTGPPVDQSAAWTNFDLFTPLNAVDISYPSNVLLRLTFVLNPTADHGATPDLIDWRARFDCAPSE